MFGCLNKSLFPFTSLDTIRKWTIMQKEFFFNLGTLNMFVWFYLWAFEKQVSHLSPSNFHTPVRCCFMLLKILNKSLTPVCLYLFLEGFYYYYYCHFLCSIYLWYSFYDLLIFHDDKVREFSFWCLKPGDKQALDSDVIVGGSRSGRLAPKHNLLYPGLWPQ